MVAWLRRLRDDHVEAAVPGGGHARVVQKCAERPIQEVTEAVLKRSEHHDQSHAKHHGCEEADLRRAYGDARVPGAGRALVPSYRLANFPLERQLDE